MPISALSAQGNLGWDQVSRAKPDGYTWAYLGPAPFVNPRLYPNLRWSEGSSVPVGATFWTSNAVVVHPSLPVNTLAEFVDHVRKHPGVLSMVHGVGSSPALNTAAFF